MTDPLIDKYNQLVARTRAGEDEAVVRASLGLPAKPSKPVPGITPTGNPIIDRGLQIEAAGEQTKQLSHAARLGLAEAVGLTPEDLAGLTDEDVMKLAEDAVKPDDSNTLAANAAAMTETREQWTLDALNEHQPHDQRKPGGDPYLAQLDAEIVQIGGEQS